MGKREAKGDGDAERYKKAFKVDPEALDHLDEAQIQAMLDAADEEHVDAITESSVRRMVLQFEKKMTQNQDLRIRFVNDPEKFLKSEVDLDAEIVKQATLASAPEFYPLFLELGGARNLCGLLSHTNTDISLSALSTLSELTDTDVVMELESPEVFVDGLLDCSLPELLSDNLARIDEAASEEDAAGVTNALHIVENICEVAPAKVGEAFTSQSKFVQWLLKRVRHGQSTDYNKVYASETLCILLHNVPSFAQTMSKYDGCDKLLRAIAVYRKRDPEDAEEEELVHNLFGALCALMRVRQHQVAFGKAQGLELVIRMLRERSFASRLALRIANHALRGCPENCEIWVDKLGLKPLFGFFMGHRLSKKPGDIAEDEERVATIIHCLCRYCTGTSAARVLNKFTESEFGKLERLVELHEEYHRRIEERGDTAVLRRKVEEECGVETEEADDQDFLDRCEAGLFTLQQVDLCLVRLVNMGNREVRDATLQVMKTKGVDPKEVLQVIEEYCKHLDPDAQTAKDEQAELKSLCKSLR